MTKSYRQIDYRLRAAKNVERKMIVDALRRLDGFDHVDSYRYVGFGSLPFVDFLLVHKNLGITNMVSIEKHATDRDRFEFNKPLFCIDLQIGEASSVLPTLEWSTRTIIWLDYEHELDPTILSDVEYVTSNAPSGSVLIVTVNAHPGEKLGRADRVRKTLGDGRIPTSITDAQLGGWKKADLYYKLIDDSIRAIARDRSGGASRSEQISYHQVSHFRYQDGPKMLTVGGVLLSESEEDIFNRCGFGNDSFYRHGSEPFLIEIPIVTLRELLHISCYLPNTGKRGQELDFVPVSEVDKLARIFRYFPAFVEADV